MVYKMNHILLIHYKYDPVAWLIRLKTNSFWNHAAWIWDDRTILECKKSGIRLTWNDAYSNKKLYITEELYIPNLTLEQKDIIDRYLINYPKKINLMKRFLSFLMIAFDSNKDLYEITCSGFIAKGCEKTGIYFNTIKKVTHVTPEDIYKNLK